MITSGYDDKAALWLLIAAAVAMFEVISKVLVGIPKKRVAIFLPALA